jgi:hypothetical protein
MILNTIFGNKKIHYLKSVAHKQYPQYVFRDGTKLLWNPILKKAFVDLPEERVRLQLIEYLIFDAGFSKARISFESPVNLPGDKSASRTDIICYDKEFKPLLLVECKSPDVSLSEKASIQIARYNQKIGAPFLLISNGLEDYWFRDSSGTLLELHELPSGFGSQHESTEHFDYWVQRGFVGNKSHPESRKWILESCELLYGSKSTSSPKYFKFEGAPNELFLPNYYSIFGLNETLKLAVSLTATPFGATRLNCVLNKNGKNTALLSASLDLIAKGDSKNTILQTNSGIQKIDISAKRRFNFSESINDQVSNLSDFLSEL